MDKTVYLTFKDDVIPYKFLENKLEWERLNPDWKVEYYSDNRCREFIKRYFWDEVVDVFDSLIAGAFKADLWRLCVIYQNGGVYSDIKLKPLVPLSEILENYDDVFTKDMFPNNKNGLWNGFFYSLSNNYIILETINKIIENRKIGKWFINCLDYTGPSCLGKIFLKNYNVKNFSEINNIKFLKFSRNIITNKITISYNKKILMEGKFQNYKNKYTILSFEGKVYKEDKFLETKLKDIDIYFQDVMYKPLNKIGELKIKKNNIDTEKDFINIGVSKNNLNYFLNHNLRYYYPYKLYYIYEEETDKINDTKSIFVDNNCLDIIYRRV